MVRRRSESGEDGLPGKRRERETRDESGARIPPGELVRAATQDEGREIRDGQGIDDRQSDELDVRPEIVVLAESGDDRGRLCRAAATEETPESHGHETEAARHAQDSGDRDEGVRNDPAGYGHGERAEQVRRGGAGSREEAAPEAVPQPDVQDEERDASDRDRDPVAREQSFDERLQGRFTFRTAQDPNSPG